MKRNFILLFLFFSLAGSLFGQGTELTGVVTSDEDQLPVPGATVSIQGTATGTITNIDGEYSIYAEAGDIIVFSYIGLQTQQIEYTGQTILDVLLLVSTEQIDELVVVGYGTQKKSLVTGSISKLSSEAITKNPSLRVEQALQGKVSGVTIAQESGSPGAGLTVRIRGTGSNYDAAPLYIVDGMRTGGIDYLSPNDIASIEVLKDAASAAIYGAEGANGVILITTKKGSKGTGQISYDFYYGSQSAASSVDLLNAEDYVRYRKEANAMERSSIFGLPIDDPAIVNWVEGKVPYDETTVGEGTNWIDQIFQAAPVQSHHLSFTGANDKGSFYASTGYYDQDGIIGGEKSNYKRFSSRFNADYQLKDWFKVESRISYTHKIRRSIDENSEYGGVVANAMNIDPITPVFFNDTSELSAAAMSNLDRLAKDGDKYYGISELVTNEITNPLAKMSNYHSGWSEDKVLASVKAELSPIEGLKISSKFDVDMAYGTWDNWSAPYYYHGLQSQDFSEVSKSIDRWFTYQWENWFVYDKSFESHSFSLLGGSSYRNSTWNSLSASRRGLLEYADNFALIDFATDAASVTQGTGGSRSFGALISYYSRLSYNYAEKYMATLNFRADGSNKFGSANRFGYFPSLSTGWVVSREDFWEVPVINFMKVRASWGQNGSLSNLQDFQYVSTISTGVSYPDHSGAFIVGAIPGSVSNAALKWETSEQLDIGIDLRFLANRLTFSVDYYNKVTKDLLSRGTIPWLVGNESPWINAGDVKNTGIEFDLGYNNSIGDFNYSVSANGSYLKNVVSSLSDDLIELQGASVGPSNVVTKFEEGMPVWYFWGWEADGIFQNQAEIDAHVNSDGDLLQPDAIPGDIKFLDNDGTDVDGNVTGEPDGVIDETDKIYLGKPSPDFMFGLNLSVDYKGFDLSVFAQGVLGNELYNGTYRTDLSTNNKPQKFYDNRWTGEGSTNDWFRATENDYNKNLRPSSFFVEDGSYLKVKQLMLGYTLPQELTQKIEVSKLRLYFTANNILTLTNYTGLDPEIGQTASASSIGIDRGLYPQAKSFMFGVNVTF